MSVFFTSHVLFHTAETRFYQTKPLPTIPRVAHPDSAQVRQLSSSAASCTGAVNYTTTSSLLCESTATFIKLTEALEFTHRKHLGN